MANRHYDWARDAEPIYTFLGIYVASFQALEAVLDQILTLAGGSEARAETEGRLARMSFAEKTEAVKETALGHARFERARSLPEWPARIEAVSQALAAERLRRNGILHSSYMLRGVELGLDAIRTHRRRRDGGLQRDQEMLDRERMDEILKDMANLSFGLSQIHLQLIHLTDVD